MECLCGRSICSLIKNSPITLNSPVQESPQQLKGILRGKNKPMSPQVVESPIGIPYSKVPSSKTRRKKQFMNESWYSEDDAASQCSDDSDVIKDLNNLSRQVNRHRGHY